MTCNQLMVLLDIHRGTFQESRHMDTVTEDMRYLRYSGFITKPCGDAVSCTDDGTDLVERVLRTPLGQW